MAWDTEATRTALLDAGSEIFARDGFAGASIAQISRAAGVSGERIYSYFGNKAGLFNAVLTHRLGVALDVVTLTRTGPDGAAEFAMRFFDAVDADPALGRLMAWEGLEARETVAFEERARRASAAVTTLCAALPDVPKEKVADLLATLVTLVYAWHIMPQLYPILVGQDGDLERRRTSIVDQVTLIAAGLEDIHRRSR